MRATPLTEYNLKTVTTFLDGDLNEVKSGTVGDALNNADAIPVKGKVAEQAADNKAMVQRLEALRPLIKKYLPDTSKMNYVAAKKAQYESGIYNEAHSNILSDLALGYTAKLDAVAIDRRANGRFPGQRILDIPLLPEFGSTTTTTGSGVLGMIGMKGHSFAPADSQDAANAKLDAAIARLKGSIKPLAKGETIDEDASDIGAAIDAAGEATP
jgi:hypothetical protein